VIAHGDAHPANVVVTSAGPILVYFDMVGVGPALWDLTIPVVHQRRFGPPAHMPSVFFAAYGSNPRGHPRFEVLVRVQELLCISYVLERLIVGAPCRARTHQPAAGAAAIGRAIALAPATASRPPAQYLGAGSQFGEPMRFLTKVDPVIRPVTGTVRQTRGHKDRSSGRRGAPGRRGLAEAPLTTGKAPRAVLSCHARRAHPTGLVPRGAAGRSPPGDRHPQRDPRADLLEAGSLHPGLVPG
jgi:hypothetical protein